MSTYDFEPDPSDYGPEPAHIANPSRRMTTIHTDNNAKLRERLESMGNLALKVDESNAKLRAEKDAYAQACQDEADSLRAEVERLKGASEPVAWQYRTRADWVEYWEPWTDCSKENHADYLRVPMLNDWHYETRALFAHPAPNVYKNGSTE